MRLFQLGLFFLIMHSCGQEKAGNYEPLKKNAANETSLNLSSELDTAGVQPEKERFNQINAYEKLPDTCLLEGYFKEFTRTVWDAPSTCDCFVVRGGSKELIGYLNGILDRGNSVNFNDESGNLVINIELESLDEEMVKTITASTSKNKVRLFVHTKEPEGKCADACFSFVKIIDVIE